MSEDYTYLNRLGVKINFRKMSRTKDQLSADFFQIKIRLCSAAVFLGVFSIS